MSFDKFFPVCSLKNYKQGKKDEYYISSIWHPNKESNWEKYESKEVTFLYLLIE